MLKQWLKQEQATRVSLLWVLAPLLLVILALALLLGLLLLPQILIPHFQSQEDVPALALLQAYHAWYWLLAVGCVVLSALLLAGCLFGLGKGLRLVPPRQRFSLIFLHIILAGLFFFLCWAMMAEEDVIPLITQSAQDIEAIETGKTQQITVWLSPNVRSAHMPGPYVSMNPDPLTRYGAINGETGGWVEFYFPDALAFDPAPEGLYRESQSIAQNEETAQKYTLTYTSNLHLVVAVEEAG